MSLDTASFVMPSTPFLFLTGTGDLCDINREKVTIASGAGKVYDGTVAGIVTATGEWKPHNPAATDGTENAAGIIAGYHDATSTAREAVAIVCMAAVCGAQLIWKSGITSQQKADAIAALKAKYIIIR